MQFQTTIHLAIMAFCATATSAALCSADYPDTTCCQVTEGQVAGCIEG
jgi:hypothetical protein